MKRSAIILALLTASLAAFAQNSIKVQVPNVVAADEQFNISFIIEGENAPSDFNWSEGDDFQLVWGPQKGTSTSITVVNGDGRNAELLQEEDIRSFDAFVAVTDNDEANILACIGAKRYGVSRVIAEVENIEYLHLAEDMGVNAVINKKLITAGRIFKFTLSDKVRSVRYMSGTNAEVLEYTVAPGSPVTKKPLRDLNFADDAVIGGLIRGTEAFIAVGDTLIEPYDRVVVFALPDAVRDVDRFFK